MRDKYISFAFLILLNVQFFNLKGQQNITKELYEGKDLRASNSITLKDGFYIPAGTEFRAYITPFADCDLLAASHTSDRNYIATYSPKVAGIKSEADLMSRSICEVNHDVQYFDGLGRTIQTVIPQGSPTKKDIIQALEYDRFGRRNINYLPYVKDGNDAAYSSTAIADQLAFYNTPPEGVSSISKPYSIQRFEASPLGRGIEQGFPGWQWQLGDDDYPGDHTVRREYLDNNEISFSPEDWTNARSVALYKAQQNADGSCNLLRTNNNAIYPNSTLFVTRTYNENGNFSDLYTDNQGRVVLRRTFNYSNTQPVEVLSTYYVYDQYGNLSFVLPPKAEADKNIAITQAVLDNICYRYKYDEDNRLIEKKIPGKGWEYIIYNTLDQVVMTQDANLRNKTPQEWAFQKYDALGRVVLKGIYKDPNSNADANINQASSARRISLQNEINGQSDLWEKRDNSSATGYSCVSFPTNNAAIGQYLAVNYYDTYNIPGLPASYNKATDYSQHTQGLLTASKVAVLNSPTNMLWSVYFYDNDGRVKKSFIQHYKGLSLNEGNYDEFTSNYNFEGNITEAFRSHKVGSSEKLKIKTSYQYDHAGRHINTYQRINNQDSILLSHNEYNEVGQLLTKKLHSEDQGVSFLQQTHYTYNSRGWLTKATGGIFNMELLFDNPSEGMEQFNGNISGIRWGNNGENTFDYWYDALGQMTKGESPALNIYEAVSYDKAGNIKSLDRDGSLITYDYNYGGFSGNQLASVSGGGMQNDSYQYDNNGNTIVDGSKGAVDIGYNILNIPQSFNGEGLNITYTYDAAGRMLRKESATTGVNEYIGGIQYGNANENYGIDFVATGEGKAVRQSDDTYKYEYSIADHLGNVRVIFDKNPVTGQVEVIQQDDYYPFGKRKSVAPVSLANEYLFNGKEMQEELGEYDHGARFYNPELARWNVIDPLAEDFSDLSPYNFVANSPINYSDPTGMSLLDWIKPIGGTLKDAFWADGVGMFNVPVGFEYVGGANFIFPGWNLNVVNVYGFLGGGELKEHVAGAMERWSRSEGSLSKLAYGFVDETQLAVRTVFAPWSGKTHLDGSESTPRERTNAFVATSASILVPAGLAEGKVTTAVSEQIGEEIVGEVAEQVTTKGGANIGGKPDAYWQELTQWGRNWQGAASKLKNISKADIVRIKNGATLDQIKQWKNLYIEQIGPFGKSGKVNYAAIHRARLMQEIINLW